MCQAARGAAGRQGGGSRRGGEKPRAAFHAGRGGSRTSRTRQVEVTPYLVTFAASARKELTGLPTDVIARLLPKVRELVGNPRPTGCKKLHGYRNRWRIRAGN